jgi:hypothetical protein
MATLVESDAVSEEEVERAYGADDTVLSSDSEQTQQVDQLRKQRMRRLLLIFMQRFVKGLGSRRFQEFAGLEIMTRNYEIFAHLLVRMLAKDWVEREDVLRHLLATWRVFWGDGQHQGYIQALSDEQKRQAQAELRSYHGDAEVIASFYIGGELIESQSAKEIEVPLRDQLRALLADIPFPLSVAMMEDVWLIVADLFRGTASPSCEDIVTGLTLLARRETSISLLRALERDMRLPNGSLQFQSAQIKRPGPHGNPELTTVVALRAQKAVILNDNDALDLICGWMGRQQLDYYRLMLDDESWGFYDSRQSSGKYNSLDTPGDRGTIGRTRPTQTVWETALQQLRVLAEQVDEELSHRGSTVSADNLPP